MYKNVYERYLDLADSMQFEEYDAMMTVQSEYWTQLALGNIDQTMGLSDYADMRRVQSLMDNDDAKLDMARDVDYDEKDLASEI